MGYTFAVGDIHGCTAQMEKMLRAISDYAPKGTVVFLGDYVDRGPNSRAVLERLIAGPSGSGWHWITLKGNHEDMMAAALNGGRESGWLADGGLQTIASYEGEAIPLSHLKWIEALPLIHQDHHRIFVHAGVREGVYFEDQSARDLLWIRYPIQYSGEFWGKHLVHGHTPSELNPQTVGNRTNVDSGCFWDGRLSCAIFDDDVPGGPIEFLVVRA